MAKPKVDLGNLAGPEGNAYCVIARCHSAAKAAGWTPEEIAKFDAEVKTGDYFAMLAAVKKYFNAKGLKGWV